MTNLSLIETEARTENEIEDYAFGLLEILDKLEALHNDLVVEFDIACTFGVQDWASEVYHEGCEIFDYAESIADELSALEVEYAAL